MSPALFESDLLERRRYSQWARLARPDLPAPLPDTGAEPYTIGYPRRHLLVRALFPLALAILLFLLHSGTHSGASNPRGSTSSELRQ